MLASGCAPAVACMAACLPAAEKRSPAASRLTASTSGLAATLRRCFGQAGEMDVALSARSRLEGAALTLPLEADGRASLLELLLRLRLRPAPRR